MDWTSITLAIISLVSGCGWVVNHRKYKQEVKNLAADSRLKDMELARLYVQQFEDTIGNPLRTQVGELQNEIAQLRYAIQQIDRCPHRDDCPVLDSLRKQPKNNGGEQPDDGNKG